MSNNIFQKFLKKLLKLENDISDTERIVSQAAPRRNGPDHSFNRRYFNNMIEVDIGEDGGGGKLAILVTE